MMAYSRNIRGVPEVKMTSLAKEKTIFIPENKISHCVILKFSVMHAICSDFKAVFNSHSLGLASINKQEVEAPRFIFINIYAALNVSFCNFFISKKTFLIFPF